jgi:hypothetical protein
MKRVWTWLLAGAAIIGLAILAVGPMGILFGIATAIGSFTAEPIPTLLDESAFTDRFHRGVAERNLRDWLAENRFKIDDKEKHATRTYRGSLCPTRAYVEWTADAQGALIDSHVSTIGEGCP